MIAIVHLKLNRIRGDWHHFRYKRFTYLSRNALDYRTVDTHSHTACGEPCNEKSDTLKMTPHARLDNRKNITKKVD